MPANLTPNQLKWVEALESGDYKQDNIKGALTNLDRDGNPESHCCLGVACEVAIANGLDLAVEAVPSVRRYGVTAEVAYLPDEVQEWLGVDTNSPIIGDVSAVVRNDNCQQTFAEIAAAIREHGLG